MKYASISSKKNQHITTFNRLDLGTLGFGPIDYAQKSPRTLVRRVALPLQ